MVLINTKLIISYLICQIMRTTIARQLPGDVMWSYWGQKSENTWPKLFRKCKGHMQSPININTNRLVKDLSMKIIYENYDNDVYNVTLFNSGFGIKLNPQENTIPISITGSAFNNEMFKFHGFHFHWNDGPHNGSEHAIDGLKYAMEAHFLHINTKYHTLEEANHDRHGFVVISVLYMESDEPNFLYEIITENLHKVQIIGQRYTFDKPIILKSFFPLNTDVFYRYQGSYTTPRCEESVIWIIFPEPVFISHYQINKFRSLYTTEIDEKTGNFKRIHEVGNVRHLQDIGNRRVYTSSVSSNKFGIHAVFLFIFLLQYRYLWHS